VSASEPAAGRRLGRILSWLIFLPMLALGILLAVSNRELVQISLQPTPVIIEAPQYVVIFAAVFVGILFGAGVMWLRDGKVRRRARDLNWQAKDLSRDLKSAQAQLEKRVADNQDMADDRTAA